MSGMYRFLRLLLLAVLALAVPMQGAVAASMPACADAHPPVHVMPAAPMHDHAVMHHADTRDHHVDTQAGHGHDAAKASQPLPSSCSVCAACSVGHGLVVSDAGLVPALMVLRTAPRLPDTEFDSAIPEVPERPPSA
ncbi:hypothetical protein B7R78_0021235 [Ralstonia solanacearum]|uniref:Uncharacterized protein n=2 Tax=Ralstonia solanacearum TaxID=305 RepID=A0AAP7ZIK6_RALSL|nr:hypothetical protein [Ralstonia solanacearum]MBT1539513.1 hypothetical protein [Ralstonia solanacearum]OYQ09261.1 hypothetical protein B7R77_20140 [Ralstonia solanacearum K60]RIJ84865.1 hypothetical protein RSP822_19315 [Ralstonia solanacearum]